MRHRRIMSRLGRASHDEHALAAVIATCTNDELEQAVDAAYRIANDCQYALHQRAQETLVR